MTCTCLFLPFAKGFVKLANILVREKAAPEHAVNEVVGDLDERLLLQPSVAVEHVYQSAGKMFAYAMGTLDEAVAAFLKKDVSAKEDVANRNEKLAEANREAVQYLVKLSASAPVMEDEKTISTMHYVLNDIVRIGELADNVTKYTDHYEKDSLVFSGEFLTMLEEMFGRIKELSAVAYEVYLEHDFVKLREVDELEEGIDQDRRRLISQHIKRLNEGKCQPENSSVFINLVGNLERAADHITYIAHSIG